MKSRRPSCETIVRARRRYIASLPHLAGKDPRVACWACGRNDAPLERAHVEAHSTGGSDAPSNFFLLCPPCHVGQEDALGLHGTRRQQHTWLRDRGTWAPAFFAELARRGTEPPMKESA